MCRSLTALAVLALPAFVVAGEPVGARVANLTFKDTHFLNRSLDDFPKRSTFVLVFLAHKLGLL